jgi:hypothetical protein
MNLPSFSFFRMNSTKNRALISGIGVASFYGWLQYTSPDTLSSLLNVSKLQAEPLNPIILIPPIVAAGGVFLPKLLGIKMAGISLAKLGGNKQKSSAEEANKQHVENSSTPLEFGKAQGNISMAGKNESSADVKQSTISSPSSNIAVTSQPPSANVVTANDQNNLGNVSSLQNNAQLSDIIESKTSRITEEVESVKKDMTSLKDDIQALKSDIKDITSTFESSLVELKAFQSEMVNPVNFMRKYFELLDIKNVSDPVNAMMPIEQLVNNNNNTSDSKAGNNSADTPRSSSHGKTNGTRDNFAVNMTEYQDDDANSARKSRAQATEEFSLEDIYGMLKRQKAASEDLDDDNEYNDIRRARRTTSFEANTSPPQARPRMRDRNSARKKSGMLLGDDNAEFLRSSIESGLTPGKIMSIVSIVDEILASMGPDGIDLVLEQYRAIGLKPEEERLIYGVVKMLNESKLLTDDIIAMLYRFGQVLGINDEDAELQYMKIVANKRNKKKRITRDIMSPKGDE